MSRDDIIGDTKKQNPSVYWGFRVIFVIPLGFEPRTHGLKGRCSTS